MAHTALEVKHASSGKSNVSGEFIDFAGERYYAIRNVDGMPPFFISVISDVDHWLFVSSTGGLTAGRVSPETALFPYVTVDKIHDSLPHTGPKTLLRVRANGRDHNWEPFNRQHDGRFSISRQLYKNLLGNKLCFEEINQDLQLVFRYTWVTSNQFGFARQCVLENTGDQALQIDLVDGLQNILPAGTPRFTQTNSSNLVDAYKWTELDDATGLAIFTLYSGVSDRAEPCESLKANVVYSLGFDDPTILISNEQLDQFRSGANVQQEVHKRGVRGAYFVSQSIGLPAQASQSWQIVADNERSQGQVVELQRQLRDPAALAGSIAASVSHGSDRLARIVANSDGFQTTAEENVAVHHYANVLFNVLRGGFFYDHYKVSARDFARTIKQFNKGVFQRNREFLTGLPAELDFVRLLSLVKDQDDPQLERLCSEYLPITFGRRHGDPSRPWNQFAIKLKGEFGDPLLSYEGNWRDIFQNWEALAFSFPEFIENTIAKFVNASTADGYNPYRITKEGIDWEIEEPDNPWSYIGYWGDHQIIYLLKLLELSRQFHPERLSRLLDQPIYSYANVPYRIRSFEALLENNKNTVDYDEPLAQRIERRIATMGADGKLALDGNDEVYQVNLLEKLLVPLLAKLGNLVVDGGVWLNTQRPEWNDANNALVGQGLSMVTLYYMRRYVTFLQQLLAQRSKSIELSGEVQAWLLETAAALRNVRSLLGQGPVAEKQRLASLVELGQAASRYRNTVYSQGFVGDKVSIAPGDVTALLDDALAAIDHSVDTNVRDDGLYHAYNLLNLRPDALAVDRLYLMLEGQVAALSSGAIAPDKAAEKVEALFASSIYRSDQHSFMLYPDRELPGFLAKNRISGKSVRAIPLLQKMLAADDDHIVARDPDGQHRFNADFTNVSDLDAQLDLLIESYGDDVEAARQPLRELYESVFDHKAFTGRSGTMFGFEGLGCIYWHMVSKLLLAVQENAFLALEGDADEAAFRRLGDLYYRVRAGIGFNKTPAEYGAFPTDPYSHTPRHSGARQPGMTGQVKEEVLTRFGELGVRVQDGTVHFRPNLLRAREFVSEPRTFCFLDVDGNWQDVTVPAGGLAFTWCQVPIIYELTDTAPPSLAVTYDDGKERTLTELSLPAAESSELFQRSGRIRRVTVTLSSDVLFTE